MGLEVDRGIGRGAGLAKWETDRLYEAGLQDTVRVLGQDMSLQSFAAFSALGTMSAGLLIFTIAVFAKDVQVSPQPYITDSVYIRLIQ